MKNIINPAECPSIDILKDYVAGKLSANDMHQVEKHTNTCEMCSDELEGLLLIDNNEEFDSLINGLNLKIQERVDELSNKKNRKNKIWIYPSIAATILILAASIFIFVNQYKNTKTKNIFSENFNPYPEESKTEIDKLSKVETITGEQSEIEPNSATEYKKDSQKILMEDVREEPLVNIAKAGDNIDGADKYLDKFEVLESRESDSDDLSNKITDGYLAKNNRQSDSVFRTSIATGGISLGQDEKLNDVTQSLKDDLRSNADTKVMAEVVSSDQVTTVSLQSSERKKDKGAERKSVEKSVDSNKKEKSSGNVPASYFSEPYISDSTAGGKSEEESKSNISASEDEDIAGSLDLFKRGIDEYSEKRYEKASGLFDESLKNDPNDYKTLFYSAITHLILNEPKKAIVNLDKVLMIKNGEFYEPALWYKSLALIQNDEPQKAKPILNEIVKMGGDYKQKAVKVLDELE
ncbi:MAG: hypothetical protein ABIJ97_12535 [Bacteroidota bacterium]